MIKVKLVTIGTMPEDLNLKRIEKWKSKFFMLQGEIEMFRLPINSDTHNWQFTDNALDGEIKEVNDSDFIIAIVNVPLEDNFYSRRIQKNKIVISLHTIKSILKNENIPLENIILRGLYAYSLVYKRFNEIPTLFDTHTNFLHDETKGCLFDMTGIVNDIIYSTGKVFLCDSCEHHFSENVSITEINIVKKEINKIRKSLYYRIFDKVKKHPIITILISSGWAVILGTMGSIIANIIWGWYH